MNTPRRRSIGKRRPRTGQGDGVKWRVWLCAHGDIHISVVAPDGAEFEFAVSPEAAYELSADLTNCYDQAAGIAPLPNWSPPSAL